MAQDLGKIIDLLKEMQQANDVEAENFDRILSRVEDKLVSIDNNSNPELAKLYITELSNSLEEKYSLTLQKFEAIEQALKAVYSHQTEAVKGTEMKEFLEVLTKNINDFYTEARQEKAILTGIEAKLADLINNKTDKEDIVRTISLLRNDFENLNHAYKATIDNVNTNLKSIMSNLLTLDPLKTNEQMRAQIEIMYKAVGDIVDQLHAMDEHNSKLETILNNVATNADLKITKSIVDSLITKAGSIEQMIGEVANKDDVSEIQLALENLNRRADAYLTKEDFIDLEKNADDLIAQASEIKSELGKVAGDIEDLPDAIELETALKDLSSKLDELGQSISNSDTSLEITQISEKIEEFNEELDLVRNIISDLNDVVANKVLNTLESLSPMDDAKDDIKRVVSGMLEQLPQKDEIDKILSENTQAVNDLSTKTEAISEKLEVLSELQENISEIKEKETAAADKYEEEFSYIYDKTNSIESWLIESNIKENSEKIAQEIQKTSKIEDIAQVQGRTDEIIEILKRLAKNNDLDEVKENISDIDDRILEIISLLKNNEGDSANSDIVDKLSNLELSVSEIVSRADFTSFIEELKTCISQLTSNTGTCADNIEEMQMLHKSVEDKLSELDFSKIERLLDEKFEQIEKNISDSNGQNEKLDDIQTGIDSIVQSVGAIDEIKRGVELLSASDVGLGDIKSNLDSIANSAEVLSEIKNSVEIVVGTDEKLDEIKEGIDSLSQNLVTVSDFIQNGTPVDNTYLKSEINELKHMIELNVSDIDNANPASLTNLQTYFSEIKNLIEESSGVDVSEKIDDIQNLINDGQIFNESAFKKIQERLDEIEDEIVEYKDNPPNLEGSVNDVDSLYRQISDLKDIVLSRQTGIEPDVTVGAELDDESLNVIELNKLLADKFEEIKNDVASMTDATNSKLADGFAYQAELIGEKVSVLQNLISESGKKEKSGSKSSADLTEINEKLADFKQELDLLSTDVKECLTSQTTGILEELTQIKETLKQFSDNNKSVQVKEKVEELNDELLHLDADIDTDLKIRDLFTKINEQVLSSENNLKDFILTDTDSIIIKLDALRSYVEKSLESMTPPDADKMSELYDFVASIKDFKDEQREYIENAITGLKENITEQNDEIKSMLQVAMNHDKILSAIDELKLAFSSKGKSKKSDDEAPVVYDLSSINELKSEMEKYSQQIENLSDNNAQISDVLKGISDKLDELSEKQEQLKADADDFDMDDIDIDEDAFVSENDNFDFVQAFELLQSDIKNLKSMIEEEAQVTKDAIPSIAGGNTLQINSKLDEVLNALDKNWLEDVKDYIDKSNAKSDVLLDKINSKLDVFVSDTTNAEMLSDITDTLQGMDENIAEADRKLSAMLEDLDENLTESDRKLSLMLEELDKKIGEISSAPSDTNDFDEIKNLIVEQKSVIENLEPSEKIEAFKKCLDELSFEVNALASDSNSNNEQLNKSVKEMKESIMAAVITIFDQVSFAEETEDIKDFVEERTDEINKNIAQIKNQLVGTDELNKNIAQITKQLQQMSSSGEDTSYTYSMQDIETDLSKLRVALNDLQSSKKDLSSQDFEQISEKLHSITSSVDSLTQEEMKELKSEISALKEQTQFLIATSDKSYNALNNGIVGFEEILNDGISGKVDTVTKMLERSADSDKVIKQALIYMGEWIDSASESINRISVNSDEIGEISENLEALKESIKSDISGTIENKFETWHNQLYNMEKQFAKVEKLEEQLENQQIRIDRMEANIDKLLSIVENLEDSSVTRKIDKIEKQISKLSNNIEKLASYVE